MRLTFTKRSGKYDDLAIERRLGREEQPAHATGGKLALDDVCVTEGPLQLFLKLRRHLAVAPCSITANIWSRDRESHRQRRRRALWYPPGATDLADPSATSGLSIATTAGVR